MSREATASRETMLASIRDALGRSPGQEVGAPPEARIRIPSTEQATRIAQFLAALEALNARTFVAPDAAQACEYVGSLIDGKRALASNAPLLRELGITEIEGVLTDITDLDALREEAAHCDIGITSADFALADTGTLVMFSSAEEARLVSLLPPVHLAIVPRERLLSGLDELFSRAPEPARRSSSMVLITGPSRTADIEQILVRGVHGPGEIHVVVL